jgi:hypothetical protein
MAQLAHFWVPCRTLCVNGCTWNSKWFYMEKNRFYLEPKRALYRFFVVVAKRVLPH